MKVVLVLPWLAERLRDRTLDSMGGRLRAATLAVDNRSAHATVAGAWNLGRDRVLDGRGDWLVLCSTTITFGAACGDDLLDALRDPTAPGVISAIGASWHLVALRAAVLDVVGRFDAFGRAYCEDADYIIRHRLAGLGDLWAGESSRHVEVDHATLGDAHSIEQGLVPSDLPAKARVLYRQKWGGDPSHETLERPFDRPDADWRWTWADERVARMAVGCASG